MEHWSFLAQRGAHSTDRLLALPSLALQGQLNSEESSETDPAWGHLLSVCCSAFL